MISREDRKEELLKQLRDPKQCDAVLAHLKSLMDLSPKDKLPHGMTIVEDILTKEYGETLLQGQKRRDQRARINLVYPKPNSVVVTIRE
jgi:hypothetical protein